MYVVGADALSAFWRKHPEAEGELRALHSLLASTDPESLGERFGAIAAFEPGAVEMTLRTATVRIALNAAAGVACYTAILAKEESP